MMMMMMAPHIEREEREGKKMVVMRGKEHGELDEHFYKQKIHEYSEQDNDDDDDDDDDDKKFFSKNSHFAFYTIYLFSIVCILLVFALKV